jgi:hypothetical protein
LDEGDSPHKDDKGKPFPTVEAATQKQDRKQGSRQDFQLIKDLIRSRIEVGNCNVSQVVLEDVE